MRVLPPPLDLSVAGFGDSDLFGRQHLAKGLTNLLSVSEDPLVIALDGQWGAGKTTFLAMWSDQLKHAEFPVIRFDAFEHDYVEDPFLALAGEVIALAERLAPKEGEKRREFVEKAKAAGKVILRHGVTAGVKLATLGALDVAKAADDTAEAITDAVKDASDEYLEEALSTHALQKEKLAQFREALQQLPSLLKPPNSGQTQKPLVFIIDELDRCRPVFALQTLERIKHFFAVENVHFVLGANLAQLRTSIGAAYGAGVDAGTYLQKFIHLTFHLTTGEGRNSADSYRTFVDYLLKRLNFPPTRLEAAKAAAEVIKHVAPIHDFNLRAIERMMMTLALAFAFMADDEAVPPPILGVLCILKVQQPELYTKAKRGALKHSEIITYFQFPNVGSWNENRGYLEEVGWWWAVCSGGGHDGRVRSYIDERVRITGFSVNAIVPWVANQIIDALQPA